MNGDYTQTGALVIKVGGTDPDKFDQLAINGHATFNGGTLSVVLIDGFMPDPLNPDSFAILSFGSHDPADDFAEYNGLDLGNGLMLVPQYDEASLTLETVQGSAPSREPCQGLSSGRAARTEETMLGTEYSAERFKWCFLWICCPDSGIRGVADS